MSITFHALKIHQISCVMAKTLKIPIRKRFHDQVIKPIIVIEIWTKKKKITNTFLAMYQSFEDFSWSEFVTMLNDRIEFEHHDYRHISSPADAQ